MGSRPVKAEWVNHIPFLILSRMTWPEESLASAGMATAFPESRGVSDYYFDDLLSYRTSLFEDNRITQMIGRNYLGFHLKKLCCYLPS